MRRKNLFTYAIISVVCIAAFGIAISCVQPSEQRDCVVMLGDSIFALSGAQYDYLQELSGHEYRIYYQSGAQMNGGLIPDIEAQYDDAIDEGDIRTIIMDGGGNDQLMGGAITDEQLAAEIKAAYGRILDKAKSDGVENIIVQGYYITADAPDGMAEGMEAMGAGLVAAGVSRGIKVVFVDPIKDAWFSSRRPAQYTNADGIHPTDAASERLAQLVWNAMVANNIEQGNACPSGSSGGCN